MSEQQYIGEQQAEQIGNYRLLRRLGQGGQASVYLAEHVYLKTFAAIKVLPEWVSAQSREQFLASAQAIARLQHPHIVPALEYGISDDKAYLVMEYAPNGTLRQRYPKGTHLSMREILGYTRAIASAVQYIHAQNLLHLDIKPENMLLDARNEVLLSDLNPGRASKTAGQADPRSARAFGTLAYMAPEQIQGAPCPASDQYALAVMVYEWLCGSLPFHGSLTETAAQHALISPPSLHEQLPWLPREVETVVMRALAKEPEQRFASIQAFAEALAKAGQSVALSPAADASITSPFPPASARGRGISRRRMLAFGAVGLVVAAGGATGIVFFRSQTGLGHTAQAVHESPAFSSSRVLHSSRSLPRINNLAWAPDGKFIATTDGQAVQIWDALTGADRSTYTQSQIESWRRALAWAPDSTRIACEIGRSIQVWEAIRNGRPLSTANPICTFVDNGEQSAEAVAWAPNGRWLASGNTGSDDGTSAPKVQVWEIQQSTTSTVYSYSGHLYPVNVLAWSPDSQLIASACGSTQAENPDFTVQVWHATTGEHIFTYRAHRAPVNTVAWSPDGQLIASGGGYGNDASQDHLIHIWQARTGKTLVTYAGHASTVNMLAWSPGGQYLASASADRTVQIWHAASGQLAYTYRGHTEAVTGLAWSPHGNIIASGDSGGTVQVWRLL